MNEHPNNSTQQLWQSQPVEEIKMSADVLRQRAGKFENTIRWRNAREYVASLVALALFSYFFATAPRALLRTAFGLFIAGLLWVAIQLHRKGSARSMPVGADTLTSLRFYRAELERQRQAVNEVGSWYLAPMLPGLVMLNVARAVSAPGPVTWISLALMNVLVAAMFFWIWKLNKRAAICLQRTIDELAAGESQPQDGETGSMN